MLKFLLAVSGMKRIPRTGWLSHGISLFDVESVAEHTFSTCALSMILTDLETGRRVRLDIEKVLRMAVLHDLAESLTFDISQAYLDYMGRRGQAIKQEVENKAWGHLLTELNNPDLARSYTSLQGEYNANVTKESRIVHAADSLDILIQVLDQMRRGYPKRLLADIWHERCKMVARTGIPSAKRLLQLVVREYAKL